MKRILILGATSAIATACARVWAGRGAALFLVARDPVRLAAVAADLRARGATAIASVTMDANAIAAHRAMLDAAFGGWGEGKGVDLVLIAHGTLPDQSVVERDAVHAVAEFATNATSVIALLTDIANRMVLRQHGAIGVITSVAGDRGRPSNYVYGSAKAAVSAFCEGLRARLFREGVTLTDIRPGFVASPMTQGLPLPAPLVAQPEAIAPRIVAAIERGRDVVYVPAFWRLVMFAVRNLPRAVFKRIRL